MIRFAFSSVQIATSTPAYQFEAASGTLTKDAKINSCLPSKKLPEVPILLKTKSLAISRGDYSGGDANNEASVVTVHAKGEELQS